MKTFAKIDENGEILFTASFGDPALIPEGMIEYPKRRVSQERTYYDGVKFQTRKQKPSEHHVWRNSRWELDIDALAQSVRADRNTRLFSCDWTQGRDIPDEVAAKWASYRQSLRDLTNQPGFPTKITWPTLPT